MPFPTILAASANTLLGISGQNRPCGRNFALRGHLRHGRPERGAGRDHVRILLELPADPVRHEARERSMAGRDPACKRQRKGSRGSERSGSAGTPNSATGRRSVDARRWWPPACPRPAETPGRDGVLACDPLDDFKDVPFGGGGQDRPGHRSAASIAASARARTSSIVRTPRSSVSFRVRAIMASNARLRSSCSFRSRRPERTTSLTLLYWPPSDAGARERLQLRGEMHVRCHGDLHVNP